MKKTRFLFTLLLALAMVAISPQKAWALGGSGTSTSPYTIASADDLKEFADIVNGTNGKTRNVAACGKLTADITLTSAWTAMGSSSYAYTGTFDGQGHKISGLNLTAKAANAGFFGYVNGATIKNFSLAGSISSNSDNVGSVVGYAKGSSTIQDIVSTVNITMTAAKSHLGGIAGNIENGTSVLGCTYSGTLNAGSSTDSNGGIVGFANANCSGTIKYCFFNGTVKTTGSGPQMGGILGYTNDTDKNFGGVQNCYSCGTLTFTGSDNYANAIVGRIRAKSSTTINNTFLSGTATRACNTDCSDPVDFTKNKAITISVKANNNTYGTVSQSYVNPTTSAATQLQVVATPNEHYHFGSWSDSGAQTHNVGLTSNVDVTASFAIDQHTISVATNNANYGTVSGGGTYDWNSKQTIKATPKTGYHFVKWNDGNTDASRSITVTGDATYTATFAPNQYTITVATNNSNYGTVSGGGTFDYGSTKTITATPKAHYHFVQWNDDNTNASRTITVTEDKTYTATFAIDQHTITVRANNDDYGTVSGGGTFDYNSSKTITATPKTGYHFVEWNDGNTNASRTITVNGNATYTATFAAHTYGDWITDVAATCTTSGTKHRQCTHTGCDDRIDEGTVIPATGHSFADDDLAQGVCTTCHHGFFRYTSKDNVVVHPYIYAALTDAEGNQLTRISNTNVDGKGVIEFNKPLANIGSSAFFRKTDLTGMTIPYSVTGIGNAAFSHCTGFTGDLVIPESVTSIGNTAFSDCSFTGNLVIPTSVTSIGLSAFEGCSGFTGNLVIPESVTSIGNSVFKGCSGFKSVEFNSIPQVRELAFSGVTDNVTLTLTDNSYIYTGANNLPAATSATFNREIVADGGMYSFIVPFDIPAGQAAELGKFYQYTSHDPEVRKVYFDDIAEVSDGVVKANTAYFFKPARDFASFTVENPTFGTTGNMPDAENPSVPGLYGTYSQIQIPVGAYGYVVQDGQSTFVKAGYGNILRPFRAYLWLGSGAYMARVSAIFGEEETNGIIDIDAESEHDIPAYDLSGQRVNDGYKGIVIKNGKKTMVR